MFDANAAGIPIGEKFFAEVHSVNAKLCGFGIVKGDIVLCEHVTKKHDKFSENPTHTKIWTQQDKEVTHYDYYENVVTTYGSLVYSGRPNGEGFMDTYEGRRYKQKALTFMNGEWE